MSLWPEHPSYKNDAQVELATDAVLRLSAGPDPALPIRHLVVGVYDQPLHLYQARLTYHPNAGFPEYVLIWTPNACYCFDYHDLNYIVPGERWKERTMRQLSDVIDQILKVVPGDQKNLIGRLNGVKSSSLYGAPEMQLGCWGQVQSILASEIGEPKTDWQNRVRNIFNGQGVQ